MACTGPHAYIPAEFTNKIEMIYNVLGETCVNVVHMQGVAALDAAALVTLGDAVITAWAAELKPHQSNSVSLVMVRCTDLTTATGAVVERTTGLPQTGTIGNAVANGAQTVATKFAGAGRGRSLRGRAFWIGAPDNAVVANAITPTYATQISDAWRDFFIAVQTLLPLLGHVVVSYCSGGFWRGEALVTPIVNYSTDIYVDSMRSRLAGRGI